MNEIGGELTTGERIRVQRERRGISREVLAGLVGRSKGWLAKIETGERELRSLQMLVQLAGALHLSDVAELTGDNIQVPTDNTKLYHPANLALAAAVNGTFYRRAVPLAPQGSDILAGRIAEAWNLWNASRFQRTEVGALLPNLILDIEDARRAADRADDSTERRSLAAVAASAYGLAQMQCANAAPSETYWSMLDHAVYAAQSADTPEMLAMGAWVYANGQRHRDLDEAQRVTREAVEDLRPRLESGTDDLRAVYGAVTLSLAMTAALDGRTGDAWHFFDEAKAIADRLPAGYLHPWTVFGAGNVSVYAVSIATELRTPGTAITNVEGSAATVPAVWRHSQQLIDAGRAQWQKRETGGALAYLRAAHEASPEQVRYVPAARALSADLARKAKGPLKGDAVALAERIGVAA